MILTKAKTKIGRRDHGRKMSLKAFEFVETEEGWLYELARGYVVVSDVPNFPHMRQALFQCENVDHYKVENPGRIYAVLTGSECKLPIPEWESERHPDISIYLTCWRAAPRHSRTIRPRHVAAVLRRLARRPPDGTRLDTEDFRHGGRGEGMQERTMKIHHCLAEIHSIQWQDDRTSC
jgi:hypothetical protein